MRPWCPTMVSEHGETLFQAPGKPRTFRGRSRAASPAACAQGMEPFGTAWHSMVWMDGTYGTSACEADSLAYGAAGSSGRVISVALVMCCTSLRFWKTFPYG